MFKIKKQQGVTLYLSLMIMAILLSIAFGLSAIFINQVKMIKEMGHSVIALCAADAGVEAVLVDRGKPNLTPDFYSDSLENEAIYTVFVYRGPATEGGPDENCTAADLHYCIKSIGTYKEARRAIEITY